MSLRRAFRGWTMLWAVLQFALPAVATYADAMLERTSAASAVAHVEADGAVGCPAVHPADCALCHLAQRFATPAQAPHAPVATTVTTQCHASVATASASAERGRLPLSRAPPVA